MIAFFFLALILALVAFGALVGAAAREMARSCERK